MYEAQEGKCDICKKEFPPITTRPHRSQRLSIDHDHRTGFIRGLLCVSCNAGIGHARESLEILDSMKAYLTKDRTGLPIYRHKWKGY